VCLSIGAEGVKDFSVVLVSLCYIEKVNSGVAAVGVAAVGVAAVGVAAVGVAAVRVAAVVPAVVAAVSAVAAATAAAVSAVAAVAAVVALVVVVVVVVVVGSGFRTNKIRKSTQEINLNYDNSIDFKPKQHFQ